MLTKAEAVDDQVNDKIERRKDQERKGVYPNIWSCLGMDRLYKFVTYLLSDILQPLEP